MSATLQYTGTLVVVACGECGITFAMPEDYHRRRRDDHECFYCPAGHARWYPAKSEAELLREQLTNTQRRLTYAESRQADEERARQAAERSARAFRGVAKRIKNRVAHGVCPGCNRTFANLARHMDTKHPAYAKAAP